MDNDLVVARSVGFPMSIWERIDDRVYEKRYKNRSAYLLALVLADLDEQPNIPDTEQIPEKPVIQNNEPVTEPDNEQDIEQERIKKIFGDIDI